MAEIKSDAALSANRESFGTWQSMDTAPRDRTILLLGTQDDHPDVNVKGEIVFSGYWDSIDEAWCSTGSTWLGPFYHPTLWQPLPATPGETVPTGSESDEGASLLIRTPPYE